jgi:polysaccharide pyruvyl transferase WcaK-like protein
LKKRFLLFGAYANGNIGDHYQATALRRHIARLDPEAEVWSASASRAQLYYEFDPVRRLRGELAIERVERVNAFSALLIGGGGLLASTHHPLGDAAWVDEIKIPIALIAVGATDEVVGRCGAVVDKAAIVTARDEQSIKALQKRRRDVTLLCDPILADPGLNADEASGYGPVAVIPRKQDDTNSGLYRALSRMLGSSDRAVSMFPNADDESGALDRFSNLDVRRARTMAFMLHSLKGVSAVFSDRYHGCILSMKRGLPCLGLGPAPGQKIASLYAQLGWPELVLSGPSSFTRDDMINLLKQYFSRRVAREFIQEMELDFDRSFAALLGRL